MGLSNDYTLACNENLRSAITRIFIAPACDISSMTADSTSMAFTAVTMSTTSDVFYEYEFEPFTKSFNGEGNSENGTATFTNTLEGKILGLDKTKLQRVQDLIDERKLTIVFETPNSTGSNKRAFVLGYDSILEEDAFATPSANTVIEAELDGENAITVSFEAMHAELIREFVGSISTNSSGNVSFGS